MSSLLSLTREVLTRVLRVSLRLGLGYIYTTILNSISRQIIPVFKTGEAALLSAEKSAVRCDIDLRN